MCMVFFPLVFAGAIYSLLLQSLQWTSHVRRERTVVFGWQHKKLNQSVGGKWTFVKATYTHLHTQMCAVQTWTVCKRDPWYVLNLCVFFSSYWWCCFCCWWWWWLCYCCCCSSSRYSFLPICRSIWIIWQRWRFSVHKNRQCRAYKGIKLNAWFI